MRRGSPFTLVPVKTFDDLFAELQAKAQERPAGSGTVAALDAGVHAQGKKVLEEAGEVWIAAEYQGDDELAEEALAVGVRGVLEKGREPEDLLAPLLAAADGWAVLPPRLLHRMAAAASRRNVPAGRLDAQQRRLWALIASGASTQQIAGELHVSDRTVKRLTAALPEGVLQSKSDTEAALHAVMRGGPAAVATLNGMFAIAMVTADGGGLPGRRRWTVTLPRGGPYARAAA